ncbi:radical SAM protein [Shimia sp.]|uniref:radical SAM protein n=1 Tax=Shimia sp. TaxID=1954381 RepID=UPI0035632F12
MKDQVNAGKFHDPETTAAGAQRARVRLESPRTLWFNTGTLCNIECRNCYILSSPSNDALVYLCEAEVTDYLDQIQEAQWPVREIGFTGGEPYMNPEMPALIERALERGYEVLVLTNAMQPLMRPRVQKALVALNARYGDRLTHRVSVDHWTAEGHDAVRGKGSFDLTLKGMRWLGAEGFRITLAGRSLWRETEAEARRHYGDLIAAHGFDIDPLNPAETVIFPEIDETVEVPEISTDCWGILGKSPSDVMCASSRMVVKRRGADTPSVVACTLLPYDPRFDLGRTLREAEAEVALNHPNCAKFCVLGGASCSG